MPIYEYSCKRCGDFEITQRISEDPLKKCPTCGAKVTKLISTSAFHLKGSGWYMTDYSKSGASKTDGDSSTSSKTTETKESSSSNASSEGPSKEGASKTESSSSPSTKESSAST